MATLPEGVGLDTAIQQPEIPTNTFIIDWVSRQVIGMDDGLAAMRQAVDIILNTERFRWQIFSSNFGTELDGLPGEEYDYIVSEIPRRVSEAFSADDRILSAENFVFKDNGDGTMGCTFDVMTVFGRFRQEVAI